MSHSYDRTMLARLGFADADRREPEHDLACRYVLENAERIVRLLWPVKEAELCTCLWRTPTHGFIAHGSLTHDVDITHARQESVLSKGHGQYKTTVGFLDAVFSYRSAMNLQGERRVLPSTYLSAWDDAHAAMDRGELWEQGNSPERGTWCPEAHMGHVALEIKISPVSVSEALRQIHLYREYMPFEYSWVLVTRFPMNSGEREVLRRHGIAHARLGDQFTAWVEQQRAGVHEGVAL